MTVRDFIQSLTKEDLDKELIISSDEEGNSFHTVDPEINEARVENDILLLENKEKPNALILIPYKLIEEKDISEIST